MMNDCTKRNKTFVLNPHAVLSSANSLLRFGEDNEVVLPMAVLEQIQEQKRNGRLSFGKRKVAKDILDYVASFDMKILTTTGIVQENGSVLKVAVNYHDTSVNVEGISDNDRRALQVAQGLKNAGKNVIFITNNPVLRMKSEILGIKAEQFKDELFPMPKEQYKGRIDVYVSKENLDKFYAERKLDRTDVLEYEKYEWHTNMFVKLISESSAAFAKYDGEAIIPLCCKEGFISITPKNAGQHFMLEALLSDEPLVIVKGSAGTGKTFCTLAAGLRQLDIGKFKKILVTRPIQTVADEKIGFLPGDIDDKVGPYLAGIKDNLSMLSSNPKQKKDAEYFFNTKAIEIQPIGYIRGRTITNTFFIIDETQNLDPEDIKSIVSRAGEGSKFVFLGDPSQVDNPKLNERYNGLVYLSERMKGQSLCYQVTLEEEESVRGELSKLAIQLL